MEDIRIQIFEGVPGSGKNTAIRALAQRYPPSQYPVYLFDEGMMLCDWMHNHVPGIAGMRLALMEAMLQHMPEVWERTPKALFILNRFHLSFAILNAEAIRSGAGEMAQRYEKVLEGLRRLPVLVTVLELRPGELPVRVAHFERQKAELTWRLYLERRVADSEHTSLEDFFLDQQKEFLRLVREQGINYRIMPAPPVPT